jgi:hypothetical protein
MLGLIGGLSTLVTHYHYFFAVEMDDVMVLIAYVGPTEFVNSPEPKA